MDKTTILERLQAFIQSKQESNPDKKTAQLLSALSSITEDNLSFGEQPQYFFANMTCNSTGVGESSFEGSKTQRTVARDYVTDTYLFIDGHVGAGVKGLSLFHFKEGERFYYNKKEDIVKLAKRYGYKLHAQYFSDLNFSLRDHRLNRHTVNITKGPFTYPIRPIYAATADNDEKFVIGYVYTMNEKEYILIEPDTSTKTSGKMGITPWLLLGLAFPPILLVVGFVWLVKKGKERMIG